MSATPTTAEDVLRCRSSYGNCELWDGHAILRDPSGGEAEAVGTLVVAALSLHVRANKLGRAFMSSQGFLLARSPDRLLAADGAYVSYARLPVVPRRGFVELAPDFLIEVRSPDDAWEAVVAKCGIWIAHGAGCAWAIDPLSQRVAECRPGQTVVIHDDPSAVARAAPVLPDFGFTLRDMFADQ